MGQTVNLLAYAFGGSNPSLPTRQAGRGCNVSCGQGKAALMRFVFAEVAQLIEH